MVATVVADNSVEKQILGLYGKTTFQVGLLIGLVSSEKKKSRGWKREIICMAHPELTFI